MEFQIYLKKRGKWRRLLKFVQGIGRPYVLDVGLLDTTRSPITTALELEEASPEALVLARLSPEELDWYIMFADALDVKRLVLPPPPTLEEMGEMYDKAVGYGIEMNWIYGEGPMSRVKDVEIVAKEVKPTAARIVYDPVKARGMREIYYTLVAVGGYIREIYLSNRRGERGPRLPPFDPVGRINYTELLQALYLLKWEGRITIRQAPQFFNELDLQVKIGTEVLEAAQSAGVSKKVQRRVSDIINELMA
ncbi:MAG: hypothetical protein ABWK05_04675 [Pyrobaculum sp.]